MRNQRPLTRAATVTAAGLLTAVALGASGQAASAVAGSASRPAIPTQAAATGNVSSPSVRLNFRVQVAQWAQPYLRIRSNPGWPGGRPGDVIGTMRPGASASAICSTQGADMTAYGRTGSTWVKIRLGVPPTAWAWDGGLNPHEVLPPCGGCERSKTDRAAGSTAGRTDCEARQEGR
ncbi:hypothetical protein [Spirillospora sp. NPDC047279]|uniref:hypothetical protein n=1 Tax=Spirillospora sp. NPDC047279 TaxID=3155478 RepID=UPI0033CF7942